MENIFLHVLNLSISAGYLIIFILLLRPLLKKAPAWLHCALWAIVGIRLALPFSLESVFSLIPSAKTFNPEILSSDMPAITSGIPPVDMVLNPVITDVLVPPTATQIPDTSISPMLAVSLVWIAGTLLIFLYGIISYLLLRRRVLSAVLRDEGVWQSEGAPSPFILGVFRPKIFIPFGLEENIETYVIAHEKAHLKRRDHLYKPIGFLLLAVYWFNPLIWIAYILLCRDIELACDERVIRSMDEEERKAYASAILICGGGRRRITVCPLAFGEVGIKERVRDVMNYKKPAFWVILIALVIFLCTAVFFLTDPISANGEDQKSKVFGDGGITEAILLDAGTDCEERVSLTVNDISVRREDNFLSITLKNKSGFILSYGAGYNVYYISGDEKEDCNVFKEGYAVSAILHQLLSGGRDDMEKSLDYHNLNRAGKYRFEMEFELGDNDTEYTAWVEFELPESHNKVWGYDLEADELIYDCGIFSMVAPDTMPLYRFVNQMALLQYADGSWNLIGGMSEISLNEDNFDSRFVGEDFSAASLRKDNEKAWELKTDQSGTKLVILLLRQKDGTYYLGYGYYGFSSNTGNSDDSLIRWFYRIKSTAVIMVPEHYEYESTGESVAPIENGTVLTFRDSPDPLTPTIILSKNDERFSFTWSAFSSYRCMGTYRMDDSRLILTADDELENIYIFRREGDTFIFDEENSSPIPSYKYSADSDPESPVPNGAVFEIFESGESPYTAIIDSVTFDIDGDGADEICTLSYGPTSGLFTFKMSVSDEDNGIENYSSTFTSEHYSLIFVRKSGGGLQVQGKTNEGELHYFDIALEDGRIILSENGENLAYWGE